MARKRHKPEEIVSKLRQVDVLVSQGQNVVDAIRQIGVTEVTYYRWRQEPGCDERYRIRRSTNSFSRRLPGETFKPRASPCLYRACPTSSACLRASCLRGARPASLDTAPDTAGP